MRQLDGVLFMALFVVLGACSTPGGGSKVCDPGATQECLCPGLLKGVQVCEDNGKSYGECDCTAGPTTGDTTGDVLDSDTSIDDASGGGSGDDTLTAGDDGTTSGTDIVTDEGGPTGDGTSTGVDTSGAECEVDLDCPGDKPNCAPQGICIACYPKTHQCEGQKSMVCLDDASGWVLEEDCELSGAACNPLGVCQSACGGFAKLAGTNVGCEFWAVDLRNAQVSTPAKFLDAQNAPFVVVVSNTHQESGADVTVTSPDGTQQSATVAPGGLTTFAIAEDFGLTGSGRFQAGIHVESSQPVAAFQFNPYSNVDVFSNDASTLLPADSQGGAYRVVTLPHANLGGGNVFPGYVAVVGADQGPVEVTISPTTSTSGGDDIPSLSAGNSHTFSLAPGEVVVVESTSGDLSGTLVESAGRIMVYAGHVAARPGGECCSDHLEQQLPPISAWGTEYALVRFWERGKELDYLRIVGSQDGTSVTLTNSGAPQVIGLSAGQVYETQFTGTMHISANQPVLVAQFLAAAQEAVTVGPCNSPADCGGAAYVCEPFSAGGAVDVCLLKACAANADCGPGFACAASLYGEPGKECKPLGDPAMALAVPVGKWQDSFVFVAPDKYLVDYVNIVAESGVNVTLDGNAVDAWQVMDGGFKTHRTLISDGVHTVEASGPATVTVYGYDNDVSYAYPGGARIK